VRDMVERAMTFADLVSRYGLARTEGLVLRYLADAYKALRQTVPAEARNEELEDLIEWLGELVRQVDSSLIDEWERLTDPTVDLVAQKAFEGDSARPITANERAFKVMVRNAMFKRVELASRRRWDELAALGGGMDSEGWEDALEPYFDEYGVIGTGQSARGPALISITKMEGVWEVRQALEDPEGDHGWALVAAVDLAESDAEGEAVITDIAVVEG
jgi:hypothetical protein